mmetsp:Transcript_17659/g.57121  ORF Transcript_17659/g.57121 Transcript_17659/m.57121 type:complete len:289 (-) Transcript_17659:455-1321(-)
MAWGTVAWAAAAIAAAALALAVGISHLLGRRRGKGAPAEGGAHDPIAESIDNPTSGGDEAGEWRLTDSTGSVAESWASDRSQDVRNSLDFPPKEAAFLAPSIPRAVEGVAGGAGPGGGEDEVRATRRPSCEGAARPARLALPTDAHPTPREASSPGDVEGELDVAAAPRFLGAGPPSGVDWRPAGLPPPEAWASRPIHLCPHPWAMAEGMTCGGGAGGGDLCEGLPLGAGAGEGFDFETAAFKGTCLVRVRGLEKCGDEEYFKGRKRRLQYTVQGQFKARITLRGSQP